MIHRKSWDQAINLGDKNAQHFYGLMQKRFASSYISRIVDSKGTELTDPELIEEVIAGHFKGILALNYRLLIRLLIMFFLLAD